MPFKNKLSEEVKKFNSELLEFYDLLPTYLWMEPDQESTWRNRLICDAMEYLFNLGGLNKMQIPEIEKSRVKNVRVLYQKNHDSCQVPTRLHSSKLVGKLVTTEYFRKLDKKVQKEMKCDSKKISDFKTG
jgi:hypothetical protein